MERLPEPSWKAGPDQHKTVDCHCGTAHRELTNRNTYGCQGAVPDLCTVRMCEECVVRCEGCNLPVCEQHRQKPAWDPQHTWCANCLAAIAAEANSAEVA